MEPKQLGADLKAEAERVRTKLRRSIARAGFTQTEVAERVGLTQGSLSQVLREEGTALTVKRLLEILHAIDVDPGSFFAEAYDYRSANLEARLAALEQALLKKGLLTRDELTGETRAESPTRPDESTPGTTESTERSQSEPDQP